MMLFVIADKNYKEVLDDAMARSERSKLSAQSMFAELQGISLQEGTRPIPHLPNRDTSLDKRYPCTFCTFVLSSLQEKTEHLKRYHLHDIAAKV